MHFVSKKPGCGVWVPEEPPEPCHCLAAGELADRSLHWFEGRLWWLGLGGVEVR